MESTAARRDRLQKAITGYRAEILLFDERSQRTTFKMASFQRRAELWFSNREKTRLQSLIDRAQVELTN